MCVIDSRSWTRLFQTSKPILGTEVVLVVDVGVAWESGVPLPAPVSAVVQLAVSDVAHPLLALCMVGSVLSPCPQFLHSCVPSQSPCPSIGLHLLLSLVLHGERMEFLRLKSCSQCLVWYQQLSEYTAFIKPLLCAQYHARHEEASRRRKLTPLSSSCPYTHIHTHTHTHTHTHKVLGAWVVFCDGSENRQSH